ncbi:MAG TPA: hypothetical protein PK257_02810 [Candidatus Woesebacteria bacterium]|nr:hypothetical protein [Candidatus Woesebacteria bacterium]
MNNLENKKFYDINKNDLSEVAGAFLEEGTSDDLRKRINISDLYPESKIEKDNWEYNEHSEEEREATINIFELGKKGYNLVIWISPDDGGKVYKEGRLNMEFPIFGEREWAIYGRHMPLLCDEKESFELAKRLLDNNGFSLREINCKEDVRTQPIAFKIEEVDDWIKKCRELMPEFSEIWDFVEQGKDVENKIKMEKDVRMAMKMAEGDNYLFESIMARMGNEINAEGGHGSSWGGVDSDRGMIISVNSSGEISYQMGSTEGLTFCKKCGCWYSGDKCPLCG